MINNKINVSQENIEYLLKIIDGFCTKESGCSGKCPNAKFCTMEKWDDIRIELKENDINLDSFISN